MIKFFVFSIMFILSGCSFKSPPNHFQYKTTNAFVSYKKNFLSNNAILAKNDLKRAIQYAKTSSNLTDLAHIYLGECALNISVGIKDECEKYITIQNLVDNPTLNSYYSLITNQLLDEHIANLPPKYKEFALYKLNNQLDLAYNETLNMQNISSKLIASSLIKESLNEHQIEEILKISSFYGYKKSVLFWLVHLEHNTHDKHKRENIRRKIVILKSKN